MANPNLPKQNRLSTLLLQLPSLQTHDLDLRHFHLFPKLPLEIRNQIWQVKAMVPRRINLYIPSVSPYPTAEVLWQFRTPVILHVCRHSRHEGLRYYTPCLEVARTEDTKYGDKLSSENVSEPCQATLARRKTVYVNFDVDRFAMIHPRNTKLPKNSKLLGFNFDPEVMIRIQHIDTYVQVVSGRRTAQTYVWWDVLPSQLALKDITIKVCEDINSKIECDFLTYSILRDEVRRMIMIVASKHKKKDKWDVPITLKWVLDKPHGLCEVKSFDSDSFICSPPILLRCFDEARARVAANRPPGGFTTYIQNTNIGQVVATPQLASTSHLGNDP